MNRKILNSLTSLLFLACNTAVADDTDLVPNPSFEQVNEIIDELFSWVRI